MAANNARVKVLGLTSRDYARFRADTQRDFYDTPEVYGAAKAEVERKYAQELEVIKTGGTSCPLNLQRRFRERISSTKDAVLKTELQKDFYQPAVMETAACEIGAMFYTSPTVQGRTSIEQLIRHKLVSMKVLSAGANGVTTLASFADAKDLIVEKYPQPGAESAAKDLVHELFLATCEGGINSLRAAVPNFVYYFGGSVCSTPRKDPLTGELGGWCSSSDPDKEPFVLIEAISPAVDASTYIKTATPTQAISLYSQIILALAYASQKIGFTHYDLHSENVLMRDVSATGVSRVFYVPYTTLGGDTYYVQSDRVATVIDYGMAGIYYPAKRDGQSRASTYHGVPSLGRTHLAIFNDRPWPLHDAYKLLMFLIMNANAAGNDQVVDTLTQIFRFFNSTEDPVILSEKTNAKSSQFYHRFALPYTVASSQFELKDLLFFMAKRVPIFSQVVVRKPDPRYKILTCTGGSCLTLAGVVGMVGGNDALPSPKSFFDFYDAAPFFSEGADSLPRLKKAFPYQAAKKTWLAGVDALKTEASRLSATAFRIDLKSSPLQDPVTVEQLQSNWAVIYKLVSLRDDLELQKKVGEWMGEFYQDQQLLDFSARIDISVLVRMLCELVDSAMANYKAIERFVDSASWPAYLKRTPKLSWYEEEASDIVYVHQRYCLATSSRTATTAASPRRATSSSRAASPSRMASPPRAASPGRAAPGFARSSFGPR